MKENSSTDIGTSVLWSLTLWVGGCILLLGFHFLPGQDLPNHIAITHIASQLLTGDTDIAALYESQWIHPTYRLFYGLTVPLAMVFGAHKATTITLTLLSGQVTSEFAGP